MSLKASTGLRNYMLETGPLRDALNLGFINIYNGTPPSSADDALSGNTLLCTISNNKTATGLTMAATAADGTIQKAAAEVWAGTNVASSTATFYRHVAPGDAGDLSTSAARLQGEIGVIGKELNITDPVLANGNDQKIDYYVINLPTAL